MKFSAGLLLLALMVGCKSKKNEVPPPAPAIAAQEKQEENYFPVTTYIRGQINDIKSRAINPLEIITSSKAVDSTWLKIESLDTAFNVFLSPVIDTANLKSLFAEEKFLDNSVNAYTWTYEPLGTLPDTMTLQRWTVYVDPNTHRVSSIFMVKRLQDGKQLHLYWYAGSSAKIIQVKETPTGADIEKETLIKWDFDE